LNVNLSNLVRIDWFLGTVGSDGGEEGQEVDAEDTAVVALGLSGDLGVAVHAPVGAPGVLDEPVVIAAFGAVSDNGDVAGQIVIGGGSSLDDAAIVESERGVVGLDLGGNGAHGDVGEELIFVLARESEAGAHSVDSTLLGVVHASALLAGVGTVSLLEVDRFGLSVVENVRHAKLVLASGSAAVKNLLLSKVVEAAVLVFPGGLEDGNGSEDGGNTAGSLVSGGVHDSTFNPVAGALASAGLLNMVVNRFSNDISLAAGIARVSLSQLAEITGGDVGG